MAEGKMAEGILAKRGKWQRGNWQRGNCRTLQCFRIEDQKVLLAGIVGCIFLSTFLKKTKHLLG
jgi:hypothetical protein